MASCFRIPHGIAVIFGLNLASYITQSVFDISLYTNTSAHEMLLTNSLLLAKSYADLRSIDFSKLPSALASDKKNHSPSTLTCVLPIRNFQSPINYYDLDIEDCVSVVDLDLKIVIRLIEEYFLTF